MVKDEISERLETEANKTKKEVLVKLMEAIQNN